MDTSKATQRPWHAHFNNVRFKAGSLDGHIAYCEARGTVEDYANAALIVEAVNSYDALRAENKVLREACEAAAGILRDHV